MDYNKRRTVIKGRIYKGIAPYDEDHPEYDHYVPEFSGNFWLVDCLICDAAGNMHPHYEKGVPVYTCDLGPIVGISQII